MDNKFISMIFFFLSFFGLTSTQNFDGEFPGRTKNTQNYALNNNCSCQRVGPDLRELQEQFSKHADFYEKKLEEVPFIVPDKVYVGSSTCNDYTSALGAGQRILSYSYYSPVFHNKNNYTKFGRPTDQQSRFLQPLKELAESSLQLYPGWRIRVYHNVTANESEVMNKFCEIYCQFDHVDFCDTRNLPEIGDLNEKYPLGRFWRFQGLGDPTVRTYNSRDLDSYLTKREQVAVREWIDSGKQFNVLRDGPFHKSTILAGLWGAQNYANLGLATDLKEKMFRVKPNLYKYFDQVVLDKLVWPHIRNSAAVFDSYLCGMAWKYGEVRPYKTQREGFEYIGYGDTKDFALREIRRRPCPVACRPKNHRDWKYC